jgi:hypothetical protein
MVVVDEVPQAWFHTPLKLSADWDYRNGCEDGFSENA